MNYDIFDQLRTNYNKIINKLSDLQNEQLKLSKKIQELESKLNKPTYGNNVEDRD